MGRTKAQAYNTALVIKSESSLESSALHARLAELGHPSSLVGSSQVAPSGITPDLCLVAFLQGRTFPTEEDVRRVGLEKALLASASRLLVVGGAGDGTGANAVSRDSRWYTISLALRRNLAPKTWNRYHVRDGTLSLAPGSGFAPNSLSTLQLNLFGPSSLEASRLTYSSEEAVSNHPPSAPTVTFEAMPSEEPTDGNETPTDASSHPIKRRPGRPPGSKNKPKAPIIPAHLQCKPGGRRSASSTSDSLVARDFAVVGQKRGVNALGPLLVFADRPKRAKTSNINYVDPPSSPIPGTSASASASKQPVPASARAGKSSISRSSSANGKGTVSRVAGKSGLKERAGNVPGSATKNGKASGQTTALSGRRGRRVSRTTSLKGASDSGRRPVPFSSSSMDEVPLALMAEVLTGLQDVTDHQSPLANLTSEKENASPARRTHAASTTSPHKGAFSNSPLSSLPSSSSGEHELQHQSSSARASDDPPTSASPQRLRTSETSVTLDTSMNTTLSSLVSMGIDFLSDSRAAWRDSEEPESPATSPPESPRASASEFKGFIPGSPSTLKSEVEDEGPRRRLLSEPIGIDDGELAVTSMDEGVNGDDEDEDDDLHSDDAEGSPEEMGFSDDDDVEIDAEYDASHASSPPSNDY